MGSKPVCFGCGLVCRSILRVEANFREIRRAGQSCPSTHVPETISMPAELTKSKLKRRTSRKELEEYRFDGTHGRELELKRNRGQPPVHRSSMPVDS